MSQSITPAHTKPLASHTHTHAHTRTHTHTHTHTHMPTDWMWHVHMAHVGLQSNFSVSINNSRRNRVKAGLYEGRSTDKLHNGVILSIFRVLKYTLCIKFNCGCILKFLWHIDIVIVTWVKLSQNTEIFLQSMSFFLRNSPSVKPHLTKKNARRKINKVITINY